MRTNNCLELCSTLKNTLTSVISLFFPTIAMHEMDYSDFSIPKVQMRKLRFIEVMRLVQGHFSKVTDLSL